MHGKLLAFWARSAQRRALMVRFRHGQHQTMVEDLDDESPTATPARSVASMQQRLMRRMSAAAAVARYSAPDVVALAPRTPPVPLLPPPSPSVLPPSLLAAPSYDIFSRDRLREEHLRRLMANTALEAAPPPCPANCSFPEGGFCDVGYGVCFCNRGWQGSGCSEKLPCRVANCSGHGTPSSQPPPPPPLPPPAPPPPPPPSPPPPASSAEASSTSAALATPGSLAGQAAAGTESAPPVTAGTAAVAAVRARNGTGASASVPSSVSRLRAQLDAERALRRQRDQEVQLLRQQAESLRLAQQVRQQQQARQQARPQQQPRRQTTAQGRAAVSDELACSKRCPTERCAGVFEHSIGDYRKCLSDCEKSCFSVAGSFGRSTRS